MGGVGAADEDCGLFGAVSKKKRMVWFGEKWSYFSCFLQDGFTFFQSSRRGGRSWFAVSYVHESAFVLLQERTIDIGDLRRSEHGGNGELGLGKTQIFGITQK